MVSNYQFPQFPKSKIFEKMKNSFVKRFLTDKASIRYLEEGFIKATDIPFVKFIGMKEEE